MSMDLQTSLKSYLVSLCSFRLCLVREELGANPRHMDRRHKD